jgi:hypothetical protein
VQVMPAPLPRLPIPVKPPLLGKTRQERRHLRGSESTRMPLAAPPQPGRCTTCAIRAPAVLQRLQRVISKAAPPSPRGGRRPLRRSTG